MRDDVADHEGHTIWILDSKQKKMNIGYQGKERDFVNDVVRKHPAEIVYHSARMVRVEVNVVF